MHSNKGQWITNTSAFISRNLLYIFLLANGNQIKLESSLINT